MAGGELSAVELNGGYLRVRAPGHPLARSRDRVYLHRALCYDRLGPGVHACHHCGWRVDWAVARGDAKLVVDHLNGRKLDLEPDNLVTACWWCNRARHLVAARGGDPRAWAGVAPSRRPRVWRDAPPAVPPAPVPAVPSVLDRLAALR